jgi:hypothetical protein
MLGVLLLTTAALKLAGQSVSAVPQIGWFALPTVQIAAAEWEIVLGLWLLSGRFQVGAWLAALVTFIAFAGVSGYLGWIGVGSCGCFGAIHASPWWAFGVDIGVVLVVVLGRESFSMRRSGLNESRRDLIVGARYGVATFMILSGVTAVAVIAFGSAGAALARLRGERITVDRTFVDFGAGHPGQVLKAVVQVRNWSDRTVQIVGGTSDCSCVTTAALPIAIRPGESGTVPIRLRVKSSGPGTYTRAAQLLTDDDRQFALHFYVGFEAK